MASREEMGREGTKREGRKESSEMSSWRELYPAANQNTFRVNIRSENYKPSLADFLPAAGSKRGFQTIRVPNHFVQNTNYLLKLWPFTTFLLPTVQHELVKTCWAIHGCWQTIAFFNCFYNLMARTRGFHQGRNI